jgi:hypothetical protein
MHVRKQKFLRDVLAHRLESSSCPLSANVVWGSPLSCGRTCSTTCAMFSLAALPTTVDVLTWTIVSLSSACRKCRVRAIALHAAFLRARTAPHAIACLNVECIAGAPQPARLQTCHSGVIHLFDNYGRLAVRAFGLTMEASQCQEISWMIR